MTLLCFIFVAKKTGVAIHLGQLLVGNRERAFDLSLCAPLFGLKRFPKWTATKPRGFIPQVRFQPHKYEFFSTYHCLKTTTLSSFNGPNRFKDVR